MPFDMTRDAPIGIVLASAAMLSGALAFQYLGGLPPCELCHWQRWAYIAAGVFGILALLGLRRAMIALAGIALLIGAGTAVYHAGVEWKVFPGPTSCSGTVVGAQSLEELRQRLTVAPVVRCDEAPWRLLGLSLAGYNAIIGAALAAFALSAAWKTRP